MEKKQIPSVKTSEDKNKIEFKGKYISVLGKRKTAVAQVRLYKNGKGVIMVNEMKLSDYFPTIEYKNIVIKPLQISGLEKSIDFLFNKRCGNIAKLKRLDMVLRLH